MVFRYYQWTRVNSPSVWKEHGGGVWLSRDNSPSVKGWPRSGRGSSAFGVLSPETLNYPVGSRRHPFTEGEFASAGGMVGEGCLSVSDAPLREGN
jgi:hypothetical protein